MLYRDESPALQVDERFKIIEPQLEYYTDAMNYLAVHYGTTAITARVRKPRDKSNVEKGVDLTYKWR